MKKTALILTALMLAIGLHAQVNWHTIEQASTAKIGDRLYFVDFYTTWCGYCKKMDVETFTNPTVAQILNRYFYPVKFDAEGRNTFTWAGKTYGPSRSRGRGAAHSFAQGIKGFPTYVLFRADGTVVQAIPGFYEAKDFVIVLWYFASGDCNRYPFETYCKIFDKQIRPNMEKQLAETKSTK